MNILNLIVDGEIDIATDYSDSNGQILSLYLLTNHLEQIVKGLVDHNIAHRPGSYKIWEGRNRYSFVSRTACSNDLDRNTSRSGSISTAISI